MWTLNVFIHADLSNKKLYSDDKNVMVYLDILINLLIQLN